MARVVDDDLSFENAVSIALRLSGFQTQMVSRFGTGTPAVTIMYTPRLSLQLRVQRAICEIIVDVEAAISAHQQLV